MSPIGTKHVVMIAHDFPPEGNAASYRPLRFVRYLPSLGWRCSVIAAETKLYERYDPGLLELVPPETEILRVTNPDPWRRFQQKRTHKYVRNITSYDATTARRIQAAHHAPGRSFARECVRRLEAIFYWPDPSMCWISPATKAAARLGSLRNSSVILATGGPWSSLLIAQRTSRLTGIPYVIDFRDSWTLAWCDFQMRQPRWARALNQRALASLFRDAQSVILRYASEAECYHRICYGSLEPQRVHLIPNGFDGPIATYEVPQGNRCTVLYTGTLGPYLYEPLLAALRSFKNSKPSSYEKLRFLFVGEGNEDLAQRADEFGISDSIRTMSYVPQSEVIRLQGDAHALLLLGVKPSRGFELCGSKIYGYLRAGRPIVAVLPDDEQKKALLRLQVSTIADVHLEHDIMGLLERLLEYWSLGNLGSLVPDRSGCESYSALHQTKALVRALEGLPPEDPFVPGMQDIVPSLRGQLVSGPWVKARSLAQAIIYAVFAGERDFSCA